MESEGLGAGFPDMSSILSNPAIINMVDIFIIGAKYDEFSRIPTSVIRFVIDFRVSPNLWRAVIRQWTWLK